MRSMNIKFITIAIFCIVSLFTVIFISKAHSEMDRLVGSEKYPLSTPLAVAVNHKKVFVANADLHQIIVYDKKGKIVGTIGEPGSGAGQLNYPVDILLHSNGNLYIADLYNHRIQVFSSEGGFLYTIGEGQITPAAIASDGKGNLYVSDISSHSIQKYSKEGELISSFGQPGEDIGEFKFANGLTVDPKRGHLYVADSQNYRIQKFTTDGDFIEIVNSEVAMQLPKGIKFYQDNLYVVDALLEQLFILDLEGNLLKTITNGNSHYLQLPNNVLIFEDKLYVANRGSNDVLIINKEVDIQ